jgi:hypothetical protein
MAEDPDKKNENQDTKEAPNFYWMSREGEMGWLPPSFIRRELLGRPQQARGSADRQEERD